MLMARQRLTVEHAFFQWRVHVRANRLAREERSTPVQNQDRVAILGRKLLHFPSRNRFGPVNTPPPHR
jgi:hypothetical protein